MALDVFFRSDIAQGIRAVSLAMLSSAAAHSGTNVEFVRGVLAMTRAQCEAFGIPWHEVGPVLTQALAEAGQGEVLELVARALPEG